MDIDFRVSEAWRNATTASAFSTRLRLVETLGDQIGPMAVAALQHTLVPEIKHAGPPEVTHSTLPKELEGDMDIRITIRPPWHDGPWDTRRFYMAAIMTQICKVLRGVFKDMADVPRVKVRVIPVEFCEVTLVGGLPVPGSELGTLYRD